MEQPIEEFLELVPLAPAQSVEHSGEEEGHFEDDFVLGAHRLVDLVVDELQVEFEELLGDLLGVVVGDELGDDLEGGYLHYLIAVFGEGQEGVGQELLAVPRHLHHLRQDFHAGLPHSPHRLLALLQVEAVDDLLAEELGADVLGDDAGGGDDLFFHPHAAVLVEREVVVEEEVLGLAGGELRRHFGQQLEGDDLVLLFFPLAYG